jgi:hypothetical protein
MESWRQVKRRRGHVTDNAGLQSLLHIGGLSNMGLCDLLKAIRKLPSLPEASRHQINEVHAARFTTVRHVEPMPLVDSDGETYAWELCEPNLMLASVLGECPRLAEVYLNALRTKPMPWSLVLGWDEFAPGDKLKCNNRRKTMVLSYTFLELGQRVLCDDASWIVQ